MKSLSTSLLLAGVGLAALLTAVSYAQRTEVRGVEEIAIGPCGALVPFVAESSGGLANSAAAGSANPEIVIDSDGGNGTFVITSILIESDAPITGFFALSANGVEIDGIEFSTRTRSLVGPIDGSAVVEAADLMGTPVRTTSLASSGTPGGNFPHQIIATNAGLDDVRIELFARSDVSDLDITAIRVSGWKRRGDQVDVSFVPGN